MLKNDPVYREIVNRVLPLYRRKTDRLFDRLSIGGIEITADNVVISDNLLGLDDLADPNADRILFWDDSAGSLQWMSPGNHISISGTSINHDTPGIESSNLQPSAGYYISGISIDAYGHTRSISQTILPPNDLLFAGDTGTGTIELSTPETLSILGSTHIGTSVLDNTLAITHKGVGTTDSSPTDGDYLTSVSIDAYGHITGVTGSNFADLTGWTAAAGANSSPVKIGDTFTFAAGTGITVGMTANVDSVTITHADVGSSAGTYTSGDYLTGVSFDSKGHVVGVTGGTFDTSTLLTWPAANTVLLSNGTNNFTSDSGFYYSSNTLYAEGGSFSGDVTIQGNDLNIGTGLANDLSLKSNVTTLPANTISNPTIYATTGAGGGTNGDLIIAARMNAANRQIRFYSSTNGTTNSTDMLTLNPTTGAFFAGDLSVDIVKGRTYGSNSYLDFDYDETGVSNSVALASIGSTVILLDTNNNGTNDIFGVYTDSNDVDLATRLFRVSSDSSVGSIFETNLTVNGDLSVQKAGATDGSSYPLIQLHNTQSGNWTANAIIGRYGFYWDDTSGGGKGMKGTLDFQSGNTTGSDVELIVRLWNNADQGLGDIARFDGSSRQTELYGSLLITSTYPYIDFKDSNTTGSSGRITFYDSVDTIIARIDATSTALEFTTNTQFLFTDADVVIDNASNPSLFFQENGTNRGQLYFNATDNEFILRVRNDAGAWKESISISQVSTGAVKILDEYYLPTTAPSSGQSLIANSTSTSTWRDAITSVSVTSPDSTVSGSGSYSTAGVLTLNLSATDGGAGVTVNFGATAGEIPFTNSTTNNFQYDTNFVWDDTNNRLGINTSSPSYTLHVNGQVGVNEYIYHNGNVTTYLQFTTNNVDIAAGGVVSFRANSSEVSINTANTIDTSINAGNIYIDASTNRVGIGRSSIDLPTAKFDVNGNAYINGTLSTASHLTSVEWEIAYEDKINSASFNTSNGVITLTRQDAGTVTVDIDGRFAQGTGTSGYVTYWTGTNTVSGESAFYYDSVNNRLGINTTAPDTGIHVYGSGSSNWITLNGDANTDSSIIDFTYGSPGADTRLGYVGYIGTELYIYQQQSDDVKIFTGGSLRISVDSSGYLINESGKYTGASTDDFMQINASDIRWYINGSGTSAEKMRIDSSGILYVDNNIIGYASTLSDPKLKTNLSQFDSISILKQTKGYRFQWKTDGKWDYGFMANEVLSEFVTEIKGGISKAGYTDYLAVRYEGYIPILTEGWNNHETRIELLESKEEEQDRLIRELQAENQRLKDELSKIQR